MKTTEKLILEEQLEGKVLEAKDLSRYYSPSGNYTKSTIPIYLLVSVLSAIIIQIAVAVIDGLFAFSINGGFMLYKKNVLTGGFVIISCIVMGLCGYGLAGYLLTLIINSSSKYSQNRNTTILTIFCFISSITAFIIRFFSTYYMSTQFDLGLTMESPWNRPLDSWLIIILGFCTLTVTSLIFSRNALVKNPFCEKCRQYMPRIKYYFNSNAILTIVNDLKIFRNNNYLSFENNIWSSEKNTFPNTEIIKHECSNCHDGHIKIIWHFLKRNEKGTFKKKSIDVFSDNLTNKSLDKLNNILR